MNVTRTLQVLACSKIEDFRTSERGHRASPFDSIRSHSSRRVLPIPPRPVGGVLGGLVALARIDRAHPTAERASNAQGTSVAASEASEKRRTGEDGGGVWWVGLKGAASLPVRRGASTTVNGVSEECPQNRLRRFWDLRELRSSEESVRAKLSRGPANLDLRDERESSTLPGSAEGTSTGPRAPPEDSRAAPPPVTERRYAPLATGVDESEALVSQSESPTLMTAEPPVTMSEVPAPDWGLSGPTRGYWT